MCYCDNKKNDSSDGSDSIYPFREEVNFDLIEEGEEAISLRNE